MATGKRKSLSDFDERPPRPPLVPVESPTLPVSRPAATATRTPARVGKKAVAFWVDPAAAKQLRTLALRDDRTVQDCMEEALNDLFAKHGMHRLAGSGGE
jgi:hypothetical protein